MKMMLSFFCFWFVLFSTGDLHAMTPPASHFCTVKSSGPSVAANINEYHFDCFAFSDREDEQKDLLVNKKAITSADSFLVSSHLPAIHSKQIIQSTSSHNTGTCRYIFQRILRI